MEDFEAIISKADLITTEKEALSKVLQEYSSDVEYCKGNESGRVIQWVAK